MKVLGVVSARVAVVLFSVGLAACGDDAADRPDARPIVPPADARPPADAPPPACLVDPTFTDLPMDGGNSSVFRIPNADVPGGTQILWNFVVGPNPGSELIQFIIDEPFALDTPMQLVQACTSAVTYCWIMLADVVVTDGVPSSDFILYPDTGTITITEAGPTGTGRFVATITAAMFNHYEAGMLVMDGCSTSTAGFTVDLPIQAPMKPIHRVVAEPRALTPTTN